MMPRKIPLIEIAGGEDYLEFYKAVIEKFTQKKDVLYIQNSKKQYFNLASKPYFIKQTLYSYRDMIKYNIISLLKEDKQQSFIILENWYYYLMLFENINQFDLNKRLEFLKIAKRFMPDIFIYFLSLGERMCKLNFQDIKVILVDPTKLTKEELIQEITNEI